MRPHQDLLQEGPRTAPEPETAEERTHRVGKTGLAGGAAAGGGVLVKVAGAGHAASWLLLFDGGQLVWHVAGIVGLLAVFGGFLASA
jgi:hypothetical protein